MARQARRAANLVPGASLRGLVFDSCFENRIPNTFGMLQHLGMPNRNRVFVSESPHLDTAGLATALRIDESEVLLRRYAPHGRGHCTFHGLHILKARIEDRVRRFSPAAIAAGVLHHPATHELRDLPFSTVGWDELQDSCPCEAEGVRQNWVTVNGTSRCHSCGGSLGRIPAVPVPEELRPSLEFIANLVDPDPVRQAVALGMLPAAIRGAGRTLLYDMVMNLARAISMKADAADFPTRVQALASACRALMLWPAGLSGTEPADGCPVHVWHWIRRTYSLMDVGSQRGSPRRPVQPDQATVAIGTPPALGYSPSGSRGRMRTGLIGAMAAARLCGVDEQALKQAWDAGRFTQHEWVLGALRVRAFDPEEVVAIAPLLRVAGTRGRAASHLGLPLYGLEQLLERAIFRPGRPGGGVRQSEVHMIAARALGAEIEGAASETRGPAIKFLDAIRHVSGRPKPWGAAVAALLDGTIPFSLGEGAVRHGIAGRLTVSRDAIPQLLAMRSDETRPTVAIERAERWSGIDALECLNGDKCAPELLAGLDRTGGRGKGLYLASEIIQRAAAGVTTFDLARRSGLGTTKVASRLMADGVPQIQVGLWKRCHAERVLLPGV